MDDIFFPHYTLEGTERKIKFFNLHRNELVKVFVKTKYSQGKIGLTESVKSDGNSYPWIFLAKIIFFIFY